MKQTYKKKCLTIHALYCAAISHIQEITYRQTLQYFCYHFVVTYLYATSSSNYRTLYPHTTPQVPLWGSFVPSLEFPCKAITMGLKYGNNVLLGSYIT